VGTAPRNLRVAGVRRTGSTCIRESLSGDVVSAGVLEASMTAPTQSDLFIERLFIYSNSTTVPTMTIYVGEVSDDDIASETTVADRDEAEFMPAICVPAGDVIRFRFTGGTAPAAASLQAKVNVQARLEPIVPGSH
jgi:hypothetical protein